MKKIIILDDKLDNTTNQPYVEIWEKLAGAYSSSVRIESKAANLFKFDLAGNNCEPLFDVEEYDLVFIHNSQNDDGLIPSNIIDIIKSTLKEKLVLFSGSIKERIFDKDEGIHFSTIPRKKLENEFSSFIAKSQILKEWDLEVLFYNYENRLIGKIMEMIDNNISMDIIKNSKEIKNYIALKHLKESSPKYTEIFNINSTDLPDYLRSL